MPVFPEPITRSGLSTFGWTRFRDLAESIPTDTFVFTP